LAALFVNVIKRISLGSIFFFSTKYLTFPEIVNVFPEPAPATIRLLSSSITIAFLCCSSKDFSSILEKNSLFLFNSFSTYS